MSQKQIQNITENTQTAGIPMHGTFEKISCMTSLRDNYLGVVEGDAQLFLIIQADFIMS